MTAIGALQVALYLAVLIALSVPLGAYMARVYKGKRGLMVRVLGPVERLIYRPAGVRAEQEMRWQRYAFAVLAFNLAGSSSSMPPAAQGVLP